MLRSFWFLSLLFAVESAMSQPPSGIMAAPNRAQIEAAVLDVRAAPDIPGKHLLELEIRTSRSIAGPNFARPGSRAKAFTFEAVSGLQSQVIVRAEAEYIGDARTGSFQLHNVEVIRP
jgi:hypothetical protein